MSGPAARLLPQVESERIDDVVGPEEDIVLLKVCSRGTGLCAVPSVEPLLLRTNQASCCCSGAIAAAPACCLQVDVEGFEPQVLRSATRLLASKRVPDILMEYSPGIAARHHRFGQWLSSRRDFFQPATCRRAPVALICNRRRLLPIAVWLAAQQQRCLPQHCRWRDALQYPAMLLALKAAQYTVLHLSEAVMNGQPLDWGSELEQLREVTEGNLQLDLRDTLAMEARMLGCPQPEELARGFPRWRLCNQIPELVRSVLVAGGCVDEAADASMR
jgi:hypothetical protein